MYSRDTKILSIQVLKSESKRVNGVGGGRETIVVDSLVGEKVGRRTSFLWAREQRLTTRIRRTGWRKINCPWAPT